MKNSVHYLTILLYTKVANIQVIMKFINLHTIKLVVILQYNCQH